MTQVTYVGRRLLGKLLPQHRLRRLKHLAEYCAVLLADLLSRTMPLEIAAAAGSRLYRIFAVRGRHHPRALRNLELAFPHLSLAEREAIARKMWENFGRVAIETLRLERFLSQPQRVQALDPRVLDRYAQERGLIIVASLHTGNWELGPIAASRRGFDPAVIYRSLRNPYLERHTKAARTKIYTGGLVAARAHPGDAAASVQITSRELLRCIRRGVPIGVLTDHTDKTGILVPFFGHIVRLSRVPATLAAHFGARLCVMRTIRVGLHSRFLVDFKDIEVPDTGSRDADIRAATIAVYQEFEAWIRDYPEQWLWSQAPLTDGPLPA